MDEHLQAFLKDITSWGFTVDADDIDIARLLPLHGADARPMHLRFTKAEFERVIRSLSESALALWPDDDPITAGRRLCQVHLAEDRETKVHDDDSAVEIRLADQELRLRKASA